MNRLLLKAGEALASPSSSRLYDHESRQRKASKILAVLRHALGHDCRGLRCLDVGCAAGFISHHLAAECGQVVGLDPDASALRLAPQRLNLRFVQGDAMRLPFKACSFDIVVCAQVYEHVPDPKRLVAEIWRVLADRGVCFFSGPNKLSIMEAHYGLPFLHWLPSWLASLYLRVTRHGRLYEEKPLTYGSLRRLLRHFAIQDYTVEMLRAPEHYHCAEEIPFAKVLRHVPSSVWRGLYPLLPNYNLLLRKDDQHSNEGSAPRTQRGDIATVPSATYSRQYFLTECDGHAEFLTGTVPLRLKTALRLAGQLRGKKVLDVGSGRGEVIFYCAQSGADAYGIDYSSDALGLAQAAWPNDTGGGRGLAHFQLANAQHLPFKEKTFDVAFMLDIVEHLYPEQLLYALREVHRTLKEDGVLIIHTMPNIWYYRIGYPLYRLVQRMRGQRLPRDPRQRWQFVSAVHVNEQDIWRLRRALRSAGFHARVWLQPTRSYNEEKNRVIRFFMRILSSWYPFRWVFCDDIFALARKAR